MSDIKKNKMIGHITWITFPNYGTFLQAFALQNVIERLGYDSIIIDDIRYTQFFFPIKKRIRKILGFAIHPLQNYRWIRDRYRSLHPFKKFRRRYLRVNSHWASTAELDNQYSGFICGSDQIWSPLLPAHYDGFYFAAFSHKPKIAYAPSIGSKQIPARLESDYKNWLKGFKAIAMREGSASVAVSSLAAVNVDTVLDPTLLLDADVWRRLMVSPNVKKPYLLCYLLSYNETYLSFARSSADAFGLDLIVIGESVEANSKSDIRLTNIGPSEFLGLVASADRIITDSYHGTIFSILFNKPFLTVQRFKITDPRNQNARVENLFSKLSVTSFPSETDVLERKVKYVSSFSEINDRLTCLRKESLSILESYLEKL